MCSKLMMFLLMILLANSNEQPRLHVNVKCQIPKCVNEATLHKVEIHDQSNSKVLYSQIQGYAPKYDKNKISLNPDGSLKIFMDDMINKDKYVCILSEHDKSWNVLKNLTVFEYSKIGQECCIEGISSGQTQAEKYIGTFERLPVEIFRKCVGKSSDGLTVQYEYILPDLSFRPKYNLIENNPQLLYCGVSNSTQSSLMRLNTNSKHIKFDDGSVFFPKVPQDIDGIMTCEINDNGVNYELETRMVVKGLQNEEMKMERREFDSIYYTLEDNFIPGDCTQNDTYFGVSWINYSNEESRTSSTLCCVARQVEQICVKIVKVPRVEILSVQPLATSCHFEYSTDRATIDQVNYLSLWLRNVNSRDWQQFILDRETSRFTINQLLSNATYEYTITADSSEWPITYHEIANFTTTLHQSAPIIVPTFNIEDFKLESCADMICLATGSTLPLEVRYLTLQSRKVDYDWVKSPVPIPASSKTKCIKRPSTNGLFEIEITFFSYETNVETIHLYFDNDSIGLNKILITIGVLTGCVLLTFIGVIWLLVKYYTMIAEIDKIAHCHNPKSVQV